jgi:hypothetical protein
MRAIRENTDCREPQTQCNESDEHYSIVSLHSQTLQMLRPCAARHCKLAAYFL